MPNQLRAVDQEAAIRNSQSEIRNQIDTPALLIDLDAMERNIAKMSDYVKGAGVSLRPHIKTHKCPAIAHKQLEAGAIGVTCAKLGEAEVMAAAGINGILIANQIVGALKIERLIELGKKTDVIVALDDVENARQISSAAEKAGIRINVIIEVEIGMERCGTQSGEDTLALAREALKMDGLRFRGLMGYEGHAVIIENFQERKSVVEESVAKLIHTRDVLLSAGAPVEIVSGAGTGSYNITAHIPGMTELQAGSYVVMDALYRSVEGVDFECALSLLTTIISRRTKDRIIVDCGKKTITEEFGLPEVKGYDGAALDYLSEEHGRITLSDPDSLTNSLKPGDKIELTPSHCCTTINLHDKFFGVRNGELEVVWDIEARGKAM